MGSCRSDCLGRCRGLDRVFAAAPRAFKTDRNCARRCRVDGAVVGFSHRRGGPCLGDQMNWPIQQPQLAAAVTLIPFGVIYILLTGPSQWKSIR